MSTATHDEGQQPMIDFFVSYDSELDLAHITRADCLTPVDKQLVTTDSGLDSVVTESGSTLVSIAIPEFSRRVDSLEIYLLLGAEVVRLLSHMQSTPSLEAVTIGVSREPLHSRRLRRELIGC